jgi:hypothetical protein
MTEKIAIAIAVITVTRVESLALRAGVSSPDLWRYI